MASSTTNLDLISSSQASKEVTANALFDAESPAALYGRRASTTANLTWGYYGGYLSIGGVPTAIANGTVALTDAATNYITAARSSGNVAASTSNTSWNDTANHARLYSAVTAGNMVTSYTDVRSFALGFDIPVLAANMATFLSNPSSANLRATMTDKTGNGSLVFANMPQFTSTIGIGAGAATSVVIRALSTVALSGATAQIGAQLQPLFGSDCTTGGYGYYAQPATSAAAYTQPFLRNFMAAGFILGAGSAVTGYVGFYAATETEAGTHYSFQGDQAVVNASDRNCYMAGAAPNYFNGAVMIGSNVDDGVNKLQVNGGTVSKHATAGIGYATGAGGTVTQLTDKSTGVTLNKVTGDITMNAAALAAGTIVSFTLTDSAIAETDFLDVQHVSGGTLGAYACNAACQPGGGAAIIYVRNNTGGSLSEAIVLKFYLNKAVTA